MCQLWIFNYTFPKLSQMQKWYIYIYNVDFDEWNNIGIHDFSIRDHLGFRNRCVAMSSLKIQNSVVQTFPNEKLTIRQNVELDECNKLCIHDFSI